MTARWRHWYRRILPAYWAFLACSTHLPKLRLETRVPQEDKIAHALAFALLAFLFWRCAQSIYGRLSPAFVWIAAATLAAYAALDEYTQPFFNRSGDLRDWLFDVAGAAIALAALEYRRRRKPASPAAAPARRANSDQFAQTNGGSDRKIVA
ncbi:VanZ like family protein [Phycisphaerae bacterium RAS1]|nr:VanZ like family protein [Phycisphaerae bacterium RAS1]